LSTTLSESHSPFVCSRIIRRLSTLLSAQGTLMLQVEAAMKQATSASATASKLMDDQSSSKKSGSGDKSGKVESLETEINTLKEG